MLKAAAKRAVEQVREFMHQRRLALVDLTAYGGEDLPLPNSERVCNPGRLKKARAVERCWELIAKIGLTYEVLESAPIANSAPPPPNHRTQRPPTRRGEGGDFKTSISSTTYLNSSLWTKPNEINDLANSGPVGSSETNSLRP